MAYKKMFKKPKIRTSRRIKAGGDFEVKVNLKINSTTGLGIKDGKYFSAMPAYYMKEMAVYYGGKLASRYEMTSATSPSPWVRFSLKADKEALLKIVCTDSDGKKREATKKVKFG